MAKKTASEIVAEVATEVVAAVENDPILQLKEALGKAMDADPKATEKALAQILGVQSGAGRTVEDTRRRKVPVPQAVAPEPPAPPPPPKPGVIFAGQPGNQMIVKPSVKKYYGDGNVDIIPPTVLTIEDGGTLRVTDPEIVEATRKKITKIKANGRVAPFSELKDEIAEHLEAGRTVAAIASKNVTVETPLVDLVQ